MDPIERIIADALTNAGIMHERDSATSLDFYLPECGVYIECCAFWTPRKVEQASRVDNVILVQGKKAALTFAALLSGQQERRT